MSDNHCGTVTFMFLLSYVYLLPYTSNNDDLIFFGTIKKTLQSLCFSKNNYISS